MPANRGTKKASTTVLFREHQRFPLGYRKVALGIPAATLLFVCGRQLFWNQPWGYFQLSNGALVGLTLLMIAIYLGLITARLVTELNPRHLSIAMLGFWRRTHVAIQDIRTAVPVEYNPDADYGGYGIRSGPRGKAFIASGNLAVELELRDGRRLLLGSQRPQELARRIGLARRIQEA